MIQNFGISCFVIKGDREIDTKPKFPIELTTHDVHSIFSQLVSIMAQFYSSQ